MGGTVLDENGNRVKVNIEEPRWDQTTYWGRARHFFTTANPINVFATPGQLDHANEIVTKYRKGENDDSLTLEELWNAKNLYDSAFHPDTGAKMFIAGRMSAQVPCNMTITGCMMTFYKTTPQVVFWQWFNQSFNALVNYTNRSGSSPISMSTLGTSYVLATGAAMGTALGLNAMVKNMPPLAGRIVPFVAVAAANCINIPMMRKSELENGVPLQTVDGEATGESSAKAAQKGISMVVASRIGMAAPGMIAIPMFMNSLEKKGILKRYPRISAPIQIGLLGFILTFATPLCCAIFSQKAAIHVDSLEPEVSARLKSKGYNDYLYFNKGL